MEKDQRLPWLRLAHTGLGLGVIYRLLEVFTEPEALLTASQAQLAACGLKSTQCRKLQQPNLAGVEADLAWERAAPDHWILPLVDARYPERLRHISQPPLILYIKGQLEALAQPQLALVGTRRPTHQGRETAFNMAKALAAQGLVITSGMAHGVDAAGHQGALAAGQPTLAVMGTGLDRIYPQAHQTLAQQIAAHGAWVSEFAIGTPPRRPNFPQRNRIISGLSLGVLVVEAGLPSGSLSTARCALEQGREVWAMPGSVHNPQSKGCHWLIKQGAKLTEAVEDVLEELADIKLVPNQNPVHNQGSSAKSPQLETEYIDLLGCFDQHTTQIDKLISRSGLTSEQVSSMLLVLELQGYVVAQPGGYQLTTAGTT